MRKAIVAAMCVLIAGAGVTLGASAYVKHSTASRIVSAEEAAQIDGFDCILVLGCGVKENGRPSDMLYDRLMTGIDLYQRGAAPKLLMSGDHGRVEYDEVNLMKRIAMEAGIPSSDIFMDHAGFSTYESMYRAKEIFQAEKILVVSQEYHLHRALHLAESMGLEAYGVSADLRLYRGQSMRETREILARAKDAATAILKPDPTFFGEPIPISGDGNATNDENSATE